MRTLFLAWQAPIARGWFPVGRLDVDAADAQTPYQFCYTQGAHSAQKMGFHPVASFPEFDRRYVSTELFPMFSNRVLGSKRRDFAEYLSSLALTTPADPIEILSVSGGERQTDSFEVFPKIEKAADGSFCCRFFLHGLRHVSLQAQARALGLVAEESLRVSLELNNPAHGKAIQLSSEDYEFIGWTPRYMVADLLQSISMAHDISARVVQVNGDSVPLNRRVLVELRGVFPAAYEPMAADDFLSFAQGGA